MLHSQYGILMLRAMRGWKGVTLSQFNDGIQIPRQFDDANNNDESIIHTYKMFVTIYMYK